MDDRTMTPAKKIAKAKTRLVLDHAFFGAILMRLNIGESKMPHPTCWVNGYEMGYNPHFIALQSVNQLVGLFAHETMHLAFKHHLRRGGRDYRLWQKATDYAINAILEESGFELPDGGCIDAQYRNMSAERIYSILLKQEQDAQKQFMANDDSDEDCDGAPSGDGSEDGDGDGDQDGDGESDGDEEQDDDSENEKGEDGSEGDPDDDPETDQDDQDDQDPNDPFNGQNDGSDPSAFGEVIDSPALDENDEKKIQQEIEDWDLIVCNAAQVAKAVGQLPGSMEILIDQAKTAKVDWRALLRDFMETTTLKGDYTFMRRNRRYPESEFILPGLYDGGDLPQILVAVDTSMSTVSNPGELQTYAAEISSILEEFECEFILAHVDTQVRHIETLSSSQLPFVFRAHGGGGTELGCLFKYLRENNMTDYEGIIFFSDLFCWDFGDPPDVPIIWLNTSGEGGREYAHKHNIVGDIVDIDIELPVGVE